MKVETFEQKYSAHIGYARALKQNGVSREDALKDSGFAKQTETVRQQIVALVYGDAQTANTPVASTLAVNAEGESASSEIPQAVGLEPKAQEIQKDSADPLPNVPAELKAKPNWVRWKLENVNGRLTKVPYQLNGSKAASNNPQTWSTFDTIIKDAVIDDCQGIGIVCDGGFIGFDLDGCRNPQTTEIAPWAMCIVETLDSYTEITPSGCGLRVYVEGKLPDGARRFSLAPSSGFGEKVGIEVYNQTRYFTVTGNAFSGFGPGIASTSQAQIDAAYKQCSEISRQFPSDKRSQFVSDNSDDSGSVQIEHHGISATSKLALLMYGAVVRDKPCVIQDEHGNNITYPSHSEADLGLVTLLAIKHGEDKEQIDSDFRESNLYREKWDRADYAERTLQRAFKSAKRLSDRAAKETKSAETQPQGRTIRLTRGSSVKPERISWLWRGRIAANKTNGFSGDPGVGKGLTTADLAARITSHTDFPDCKNELDGPKDVVFLSSEDGRADMLVPRLKAAGANMDRIHFADVTQNTSGTISEGLVCLNRDLGILEEMLKAHPDIVLIVVDPVNSFFGDGVESNADKDLRPIYHAMKAFAEKMNIAWLLVAHLNKNQAASAVNRTSGAKTMINAPRVTWIFSKDPKDPDRILLMAQKVNISKAKTLAFRIVGVPFEFGDGRPPEDVPKIVWEGETDHRADDVLADTNNPSKRGDSKAETLLKELLESGAMKARDIYGAGAGQGLDDNQMKRARYALGYVAGKIGGTWFWAKSKEDLDAQRQAFYAPGPTPVIGSGGIDLQSPSQVN